MTPHAVRYFSLSFPFLAVVVGWALDQFLAVSWCWVKVGGMLLLLLGVGVDVIPYDFCIMAVRNNYSEVIRSYLLKNASWVSSYPLVQKIYFPETLDERAKPRKKVEYWVTDIQDGANYLMFGQKPVSQRLQEKGCIPLDQESQFDQGERVARFFAFDHNNRLYRVLGWLKHHLGPKIALFDLRRCSE